MWQQFGSDAFVQLVDLPQSTSISLCQVDLWVVAEDGTLWQVSFGEFVMQVEGVSDAASMGSCGHVIHQDGSLSVIPLSVNDPTEPAALVPVHILR